ncbi:MAG: LCP family protein [Caldilineaceae bacterium]
MANNASTRFVVTTLVVQNSQRLKSSLRQLSSFLLISLLISNLFTGVATAHAAPQPHFEQTQKPASPTPPLGPRFPKSARQLAPTPPRGPAFDWSKTDNYLVLGTDQRPDWNSWRTDTIIVVGLDRALNRAAVFSVPRDLYVQIPGHGWDRINQVDYMGEAQSGKGGGPLLLSKVLSTTLGISTQHWVRLRMDGFVSIVDAVGGVTVHLDCPFYEPIFNLTTQAWDYFTLPAGDNQLDGQTAYWFVRLRYYSTDIARGQRQRQFLWGLRNQILNANLLLRLPELWKAFQGSFTTDLGLLDILNLVSYGASLEPQNVRASGLTLADLQNYTTEQGAAVLRIGDPQHVRAVTHNIWSAPAMIDTNHQDTTQCAPLPTGAKVDKLPAGLPPDVQPNIPITQTKGIKQPTH